MTDTEFKNMHDNSVMQTYARFNLVLDSGKGVVAKG